MRAGVISVLNSGAESPIQEEDSLLEESQIKNFIEGDGPSQTQQEPEHAMISVAGRESIGSSSFLTHQSKSDPLEQYNNDLVLNSSVLKTSSRGFKRGQQELDFTSDPKRKTLSRTTLTYRMPKDSLSKSALIQDFTPLSYSGKNKFRGCKKTIVGIQISRDILNKKVWSDKMLMPELKRSLHNLSPTKKAAVHQEKSEASSSKLRSRRNSSSLSHNPETITTEQTAQSRRSLVSFDASAQKKIDQISKILLLKTVENSTWVKFNPEHLRKSMMLLSIDQKERRRAFFAEKDSEINRGIHLKATNKMTVTSSPLQNRNLSAPQLRSKRSNLSQSSSCSFNRQGGSLKPNNQTPVHLLSQSLKPKTMRSQRLVQSEEKKRKLLVNRKVAFENPIKKSKFGSDYIKAESQYV